MSSSIRVPSLYRAKLDSKRRVSSASPRATPIGFAEFWLAYPKKVGKGAAETAWKKHRPPLDVCVQAIASASSSHDWTKDGGQFVPNPATWINQRRWEDGHVPINGKPVMPEFMRGAL
jgi:hypothetical protein